MKKGKRLAFLSIIMILTMVLTGCVTRVLDFTVVSSKNVDMRLPDTAKGSRVEGKDMASVILGIPLGNPNLKEAVDRAIESAGPGYDALVDGVIYAVYNFYLLYGTRGFRVEGTPIKTSEIITVAAQESESEQGAENNILYHSSLGRDNTTAIKNIGIEVIKRNHKE